MDKGVHTTHLPSEVHGVWRNHGKNHERWGDTTQITLLYLFLSGGVLQMKEPRNIVTFGVWDRWFISLRLYPSSNWGYRQLSWPSNDRHAFDFGRVSLLVEGY